MSTAKPQLAVVVALCHKLKELMYCKHNYCTLTTITVVFLNCPLLSLYITQCMKERKHKYVGYIIKAQCDLLMLDISM